MGSADDRPRKQRHPLTKVPKYEEPNALPIPGFGSDNSFGVRYGRFGHGSDGRRPRRPNVVARSLLRILGVRTEEHELPPSNEDDAHHR
jgi:hypothetical protein